MGDGERRPAIVRKGEPVVNEEMSDQELRAKLRPIFQRFDEDGSGSISTAEMGRVVSQLKMPMTREELAKLMIDADPDGSGEIDFDEFVAVLKRQLNGDGGGLGAVFLNLGSSLGWMNPLSWFSSAGKQEQQPEEQLPEPARTLSSALARTQQSPLKAALSASRAAHDLGGAASLVRERTVTTPGSGRNPIASTSSSVGTPSTGRLISSTPGLSPIAVLGMPPPAQSQGEDVPTVSAIAYAKWQVSNANKNAGDEAREHKRQLQALKDSDLDAFMQKQYDRVDATIDQEGDYARAVAACKARKNSSMRSMRAEYHESWAKELETRDFLAADAMARLDARDAADETRRNRSAAKRRKQAAAFFRKEQRIDNERRDRALATKLAHQEATRSRTARVRLETRPEVRMEGREMFQAQRDAIGDAGRDAMEEQTRQIAQNKADFFAAHDLVDDAVREQRAMTRASREALQMTRKADADAVKAKTQYELARKGVMQEEERQQKQDQHDAIFTAHSASAHASQEVHQSGSSHLLATTSGRVTSNASSARSGSRPTYSARPTYSSRPSSPARTPIRSPHQLSATSSASPPPSLLRAADATSPRIGLRERFEQKRAERKQAARTAEAGEPTVLSSPEEPPPSKPPLKKGNSFAAMFSATSLVSSALASKASGVASKTVLSSPAPA